MRVSDVERKVVEQRLNRAHADGQLDLDELDTRLAALWQSKTRGDLALLIIDLPAVPTQPPMPVPPPMPYQPPPPPRPRRGGGRIAMRVLTTIWAAISALNFAIWLIVSISDLHIHYPWFIWVVGPWGAVLGTIWLSMNAGQDHGRGHGHQ
jgi:hypothetical protein